MTTPISKRLRTLRAFFMSAPVCNIEDYLTDGTRNEVPGNQVVDYRI